jgi:cyclase
MTRAFLTTAAILMSSSAMAQTADVTIKVEQIAPGVAVLFGQGGNIGLSYGEDGNVLIDDQFAPLTPKILAAVSTVDPDPVKFLINTHWHGDHTGGNENLGKSGTVILAHDNVRVRMMTPQTRDGKTTPPSPKIALPVLTYEDGLSLHMNGDDIRTIHVHDAHTDGDSFVMWKKANVVHMGDLFFNKVTLPFIDLNSGGNARGLLAAANKVLAMTNETTRYIPGHGPMATRGDLIAYRDMLKTVIESVAGGIKAKRTLAQIQADKPAAKWEVPGAFISGDAFVKAVFDSLNKPISVHAAH